MAAGLIAGIVFDAATGGLFTWDRLSSLSPDRLESRSHILAGVLVYIAILSVTSGIALLRAARALIGPLLVFVASACVGGALHASVARTIPASSIEQYTQEDRRIARVSGVVISEPRVLGPPGGETYPFHRWSYRSDRTALLLRAESIEGAGDDVPVTGRVRVIIGEAVLDLRENERVEVFGWLYRLQPPRNPGSFDWASFYRRQGVVAGMYCKHRENVRRLDAGPPRRGGLVTWLRTTVRGLLTDDLATGADEEASLLEAMVLGHRSQLDRRLNDVFIRAGVIHFLAVSGTHVVVLLSFVWLVGRVFARTKRQCAWLMIAAVCGYALIAEPRPPILRAAVMALLFCLSLVLGRPRARLNWISAAAVVLLVCDPATVFDVGFQLSFAAVLGVTYLTPALLEGVASLRSLVDRVIFRRPFANMDRELAVASDGSDRSPRSLSWAVRRTVRWLVGGFVAVSFGAWLAGAPIVAVHFNRLHPWSPISSVIVFPLMYVVMILGLAKIVITGALPALASVTTEPFAVVPGWLIRTVEALASLPGAALTIPCPPRWLLVSYYVFLVLYASGFRRSPLQPRDDGRGSECTAALQKFRLGGCSGVAFVLLIFGSVMWQWPRHQTDRLVVTVLSVGAGLATVIELPDGRTILYDAGSSNPYDVGRNTVVPFLRHRGIRWIERVHVSHPNLDHFSGLPSILDEVDTGPVVVNEYFDALSPPGSPSRRLLDLLAAREHPVKTLDGSTPVWKLGGVTFEMLSPGPGMWDRLSSRSNDRLESLSHRPPDKPGSAGLSSNDASTVLRLSYAGHSVLLTGDIEERSQRVLLERGDLRADVLVLPHHGSVRSSTKPFFDAVGAGAAIRSSHERMAETFSGLQRIVGTTPLYNTADVGAVQVVIDADGVRVSARMKDEW